MADRIEPAEEPVPAGGSDAQVATEGTAPNPAPPALPRRLPRPTAARLALVPLILILLLAGALRFTGLNWDDNQHLHPDERFLTIVATQLASTDPVTYLKTSISPLNPYNQGQGFYVYGNFPMTVTRLAGEWLDRACDVLRDRCGDLSFVSYDGVHLVGRVLSGMLDLVSILFIFLIGRRLYGWPVGLLGALFLAVAVMPIQQSHFFTMDNWAAGLTTVTFYAAVRAAEAGGRWRWWVLFGVSLGLAVASRINVAPLAVLAGVAAALWLARRAGAQGLGYIRRSPGQADLQRAALGVALAAVVSLAVFRVAQPYAFMDPVLARQSVQEAEGRDPGTLEVAMRSLVGLNPQWRANMAEIQRLQSPDASFPPALQWTDRAPILFPLTNMVLYGMGVGLGVMAWLGFLWATWRLARGRQDWWVHALPLTWIALYFGYMGTRWVKSIRYFLPIYPMLLLLAGWLLLVLWRRATAAKRPRLARLAVAATGLGAFAVSLIWAVSFVGIYQKPVTRVAASVWMYENLPGGASLVYEVDGEIRTLALPMRAADLFPDGAPMHLRFTLPVAGTVNGVRFHHLSDSDGDDDGGELLRLRLSPLATPGQVLGTAETRLALDGRRRAEFVPLPRTLLAAGTEYLIEAAAGPGGMIHAGMTVVANEHWDDALPVRLGGRDPYSQFFTGVSLGQVPVAHADNEDKRAQMLAWVAEADVIVLSSQRAIWNTARLPLTFPLTMRYYEALFSGELGFDLAAQFHATFQVGPLHFSDTTGTVRWGSGPVIGWPPPGPLAAEEAFSVYDHPPVWIFVKGDRYEPARAAAIINAVDLSQQLFQTPGEASRSPNGLLLSDVAFAEQRANGTFRELFQPDGLLNRQPALAAVVWWLAIVALGWVMLPLMFVVFRGLPDRGFGLGRVLALLFVSYGGWIAASLKVAPNSRGTLLFWVLSLVVLNAGIFLRRRDAILSFVRRQRRQIARVEVLGAALFLLFIGIRLGNPDVWDVIWGGEKPMDLSYFTAVLKSTTFPPYDPWFAGGYINYYYYGFVFVGALTKLLGIIPATAYNLILPMLFSFTGLGAYTVAYNLVAARDDGSQPENSGSDATGTGPGRRHSPAVIAGLAAVALCLLLGNLDQVNVIFGAWQRTSDSTVQTGSAALDTLVRTVDGGWDILVGGRPPAMYPGDWFWTATRAIEAADGEVAPITEFPYFTFLYGDLHAHMISMPLMLLALAWVVAIALQTPAGGPLVLGQLVVGGLAIGALRATNTWDWPTYLVLGSLAILFYAARRHSRSGWRALGEGAFLAAGLVGLAVVAFLPFAENYGVGYASAALWEGSRTTLGDYLTVYGLFLFLAVTHIAREFRSWSRGWTLGGLARLEPIGAHLLLVVLGFLGLLLVLLLRGYWIAPLVLFLVAASGLLSLRPGLPAARRVVLALTASALFLTLAVEVVVLQGDIGRMNTVFKFYIQVWLMLSVIGGAAFAFAWSARRGNGPSPGRRVWTGGLVVLVVLAALYTPLATAARWQVRMSPDGPTTLDGMAFMTVTEYQERGQVVPLRHDYEAIGWLHRNVVGSPVIAEAHSDNPYRSIGNRIAMYTGLPAIVGWDWHQRQQRAVLPGSLVGKRIEDVNRLYDTADVAEAATILDRYEVEYIYVGQLEWVTYRPEGLRKFDRMVEAGLLEEVYRNGGVSIYRVQWREGA